MNSVAATLAPTTPERVGTARRVLYVHQSSDLYGSDRVLHDVVLALQRSGGEPIVVLPDGGPLVAALRARGIETHAVAAPAVLKLSRSAMSARGLLRWTAAVLPAVRAIDRIVAGRPIDLVHSNTLAVMGGALWARWRGVPHLWHVHEMVQHPRPAAWLLPRLVRALADQVVCNSGATRQWLLQAQPALAHRSRVVWNGIDALPMKSDPELAARFRPGGVPLAVGLVGRINRMKGHATLLKAAELLHARGQNDFSLVFVGSPANGQEHWMDALEQRVAGSPLAPRVVLTGFLDDVGRAMQALDVVCVPSTEAEAFGLVAIEAMAASRPVLASASGGLVEVVGDSGAGWLHAPGDAATLANQLQRLLVDAPLRARMGQAGRDRYAAHFTTAAMTRGVLAASSMENAP